MSAELEHREDLIRQLAQAFARVFARRLMQDKPSMPPYARQARKQRRRAA